MPLQSAKRYARTYEEAKRIKRESETDRDRGELQERSAITFRRYLDEWVCRYRGQGRRGFRETTREEYRRLIGAYVHRYFPARLKLVDVSTYTLPRFVDGLADEEAQGKTLGDRTIANATIPLRSAPPSGQHAESSLGSGLDLSTEPEANIRCIAYRYLIH